MFLSKPQKALLELLYEYGGLPTVQAEKLLQLRNEYNRLHMEPVIHQLVCSGMIEEKNGIILPAGGQINPEVIEALDIMLLLSPEDIQMFQRGKAPFTLTFFKIRGDKLYRYDACPVPSGNEPIVCAMLEGVNHKYRMIVFLVDHLEQQKLLQVGCEHCFTVRENGTYRFYM